jgi:hypothetical protein
MSGWVRRLGWLLFVAAAGCARVHVSVRREALETIAATAVAGFAAGSNGDQPHASAGKH